MQVNDGRKKRIFFHESNHSRRVAKCKSYSSQVFLRAVASLTGQHVVTFCARPLDRYLLSKLSAPKNTRLLYLSIAWARLVAPLRVARSGVNNQTWHTSASTERRGEEQNSKIHDSLSNSIHPTPLQFVSRLSQLSSVCVYVYDI